MSLENPSKNYKEVLFNFEKNESYRKITVFGNIEITYTRSDQNLQHKIKELVVKNKRLKEIWVDVGEAVYNIPAKTSLSIQVEFKTFPQILNSNSEHMNTNITVHLTNPNP